MHSEPCTKDNLTIGYGNLQFYNIYIYIYIERERERERERELIMESEPFRQPLMV